MSNSAVEFKADAICPACGQPNACARAAGTDATQCWCFEIAVTPELLAHLRQKHPSAACLCRTCLERARAAVPSAGL